MGQRREGRVVWGGSEWVNLRWKCGAGGRRGQRGEDRVCRGHGVNQVGWMCGWQGYVGLGALLMLIRKVSLLCPDPPPFRASRFYRPQEPSQSCSPKPGLFLASFLNTVVTLVPSSPGVLGCLHLQQAFWTPCPLLQV